jgi:hypothetical protein
MIIQNVEVLSDNRLYGTHVYRKGDVVTVTQERAKELVKRKEVRLTERPATPLPTPIPRSEQIRAKEQAALNPAPARAERATAKPVK